MGGSGPLARVTASAYNRHTVPAPATRSAGTALYRCLPRRRSVPVVIEPVQRRRDLRRFLHLPFRLHRDHPGWVPPLLIDERHMFDRRRNGAFRYSDCALWLARDGRGEVVGRIGGIINRRYNGIKGEHQARFTHLDCVNDVEVMDALLGRVKLWAHEAGMEVVIGPMGFTDQDPEGFVIEGFDEEPSIATYHNREYIVRLLNQLGWAKDVDYVVYKVPVPKEIPPFYERVYQHVARHNAFRLLEFTHRRELKPLIRPVLALMNETYVNIAGYAPLDREEMEDLARRYLPVISPRFVKVVAVGNEPVGFIIGIPNVVEGIRRARGRLLPVGWYWILRSSRRARRLDLLLGGIKEAYRGKGVDVLMGRAMIRSAQAAGFESFDSHHELESNTKMRAEMERMGGQVYKRYRVFRTTV